MAELITHYDDGRKPTRHKEQERQSESNNREANNHHANENCVL